MRAATPTPKSDIDLGALAQRVTTVEDEHADLSDQITSLRTDVGQQITSLRAEVGDQLRVLGHKIDAQATTYASARSTNWQGFWSTAATVGGVLLALGAAVLTPMMGDLSKTAMHLDHVVELTATKADVAENLGLVRARIGKLEDKVEGIRDSSLSIREHDDYKTATKDRIDELERTILAIISDFKTTVIHTDEEMSHQAHSLEGVIVSRPENEAHWADVDRRIDDAIKRLDSLSVRLNEEAKGTATH